MTYFPWSNDYSVGIRIIDNDHKDLFGMVNALHAESKADAPAKNIDNLLAALSRYVEEHFEREEELMAAYNYPGLSAHKLKHKELALDVHALRKAHASQPRRIDRDKLLEYLKNWLSNHIMRSDMDYVPYLRSETGKKATKERRKGADRRKSESSISVEVFDDRESVDVVVNVAKENVSALRRCADLLRGDDELATALKDLVFAQENLTHAEAEQRVEKLLAD